MVRVPAMSPEFPGDLANLALRVRQHRAVVSRLDNFVGRPRLCQPLLQIVETVGAHGAALTTEHNESHGPVELRYLILT
jgi:hypothetical protein